MSRPQARESEYLLGNGWLPSPSTHGDAEGAWEHPVLSRVPDNFGRGLYESGLARWPTGVAVVLQVVEEKRRDDETARSVRRVGTALNHTMEFLVAAARAAKETP